MSNYDNSWWECGRTAALGGWLCEAPICSDTQRTAWEAGWVHGRNERSVTFDGRPLTKGIAAATIGANWGDAR